MPGPPDGPLEVPPTLGGDDPWHFLQPEGDETLEQLRQADAQTRQEVGLALQRCFATPAGHESLALIRNQVAQIPSFVPGWTTEQHAPCLIRRQAILDMCDWIEEQIRKATT